MRGTMMERNKPKDVIDALRCKLLDFFVSSQHRGLPCKATEAPLFRGIYQSPIPK